MRLRAADRLAHRRDQRRLAVRGRLEEGARAEAHRHARQRDRHRLAARRASPAHSPRRGSAARGRCCSQKAVSASTASSPSASTPLSSDVDALVGQRQLDLRGAPRLQQRRRAIRAAARPARTARAAGYGIRACRRCWCELLGVEADQHPPARPSARAGWPGGGCCGGDRCGARISVARPCCASAPAIRSTADSRDRPRRRHAAAGSRRIRGNGGTAAPGGAGPARRAVVGERCRRAPRTATWRPLAVTPSPRAAMRTIGSLTAASARDARRPGRRRSSPARRSRRRGRAARRRRRRPRTPACPRARIAAMIPASTSPVPALASQAGAGGAKPSRPSGAATSVSGPL